MNALNAKKANMEARLSKIAGTQLEITIRGDKNFTFTFNSVNKAATDKLVKFFNGYSVAVDADEECGTCIYVDA